MSFSTRSGRLSSVSFNGTPKLLRAPIDHVVIATTERSLIREGGGGVQRINTIFNYKSEWRERLGEAPLDNTEVKFGAALAC